MCQSERQSGLALEVALVCQSERQSEGYLAVARKVNVALERQATVSFHSASDIFLTRKRQFQVGSKPFLIIFHHSAAREHP